MIKTFRFDFLVFFVYWHINLHGLCQAKAILVEEQQWYYLTNCWETFGRVHFEIL